MQGFLMILLKIPASALQLSANKLLVQKVLSVFQQALKKQHYLRHVSHSRIRG
jgi:hypothetical protein